jgi:hypothetical protein
VICCVCRQQIPAGVTVIQAGAVAFCGPCLADQYTPLWRQHSRHTGDYATCADCLREEEVRA